MTLQNVAQIVNMICSVSLDRVSPMDKTDGTTLADLAARLKAARERVYPTAAEAARALGMKPVTLRAHENGQNGIAYDDLERYARRYGVSIVWLIVGKGSEQPEYKEFQELGETLEISGTIQDGVWLADPPEVWEYARETPKSRLGNPEFVNYSDPRFPAQMVRAYKLKPSKFSPEYDGESVVFAVPRHEIGIRDGDHVIIYLEKGAFTQATIRRAVRGTDGLFLFNAIISDEAPLTLSHYDHPDMALQVTGVVVGAQIRRNVNLPNLDTLRELP